MTHQTGCPYDLYYVMVAEADLGDFLGKEIAYLESFLHYNYREFNERGEWFELKDNHLVDIALFLESDRELGVNVISKSLKNDVYNLLKEVPEEGV